MSKIIKNKWLIILLAALLLFGIWNLVWYLSIQSRYNSFEKVLTLHESGSYYIVDEEGYTYSVNHPDYLRLTGNLGISNLKKGEALIIWPLATGGYEFGFRLQKDGSAFEIYVDENMNPVDKNDAKVVQLVNEHKDVLDKLYAKANKVWDL